jgi:hypothetical protein
MALSLSALRNDDDELLHALVELTPSVGRPRELRQQTVCVGPLLRAQLARREAFYAELKEACSERHPRSLLVVEIFDRNMRAISARMLRSFDLIGELTNSVEEARGLRLATEALRLHRETEHRVLLPICLLIAKPDTPRPDGAPK